MKRSRIRGFCNVLFIVLFLLSIILFNFNLVLGTVIIIPDMIFGIYLVVTEPLGPGDSTDIPF